MLREVQLEQARKLLGYLDTSTTALADGIYRNPSPTIPAPPSSRASATCSSVAARSCSG